MTDTLAPMNAAPAVRPSQPEEWSEAIWLDRLGAVVGRERATHSDVARALPSILVALGWPGTGRNLAATLPPADAPLSVEDLRHILSQLGYRTHALAARGTESDTDYLRPGSIARRGDLVAVYLGRPEGRDAWIVGDRPAPFAPEPGDTIVTVEPDPDFHPVDTPQPRWFRGLIERMRDALFALFAMSTVINLLALAGSLFTMAVYSMVIPSGEAGTVWGIALLAVVATIGGSALRLGRQMSIARIGGWAGVRIAEAAMRKMLSLPLDISARFGVQNNTIRLRSFETARQFLVGMGGSNLIDYPFVVIFLIVIALMGGWLVFVPIVSLVAYALLSIPTADYVSSKSSAAGVASARLEEMSGAAFAGVSAFQNAGAGSQWMGRFVDRTRTAAARNRDYAIAVARAQAIGQAISQLTVLATMCVGIVLVLDGTMNAGGLVASMMLIWRITSPAQQAFGSLVRLRQVQNSVRQLDQLMMTPSEKTGVEIGSPRGLNSVTLTVERLYYRNDAEQEPALNGVSFAAPAGARVAIVGPNAGGKTALLECLAGLRRPQSGRVLLNGRDMRQFDATEYRAWIGYVPQIVPALPLTVRDYVRLRVPTLTDAEALTAFERVLGNDWNEIPAISCGRDDLLGRYINPFSDDIPDLKFRYAIAFVTATLGDPAVLLLDGLGIGGDPEWDARVLRYLDTIRGRTTVIWTPYTTAHIQSSDQMVILERGGVLHAGPVAPPAAKAGQEEIP